MTLGTLDIRGIDLIEWYDGEIAALLELGEERAPSLCVALAWSPESQLRVYVLVPTSFELAAELKARLERKPTSDGNWAAIKELMARGEAAHVGPVVVFAAESVRSQILGQLEVLSSELPMFALHDDRTSATLGDGRLRRWLGRLGVPTSPDPFAPVRLRFGHYLELSGPGWEARAERLGLTASDRAALNDEFSKRSLIARGTTGAEIARVLGDGYDNDPGSQHYDLGVRADYLFEFRLNEEEDRVIDSGYVRREPRQLSLVRPGTTEEAALLRRQLVGLGVTASELRSALGQPSDRSGWWPFESWDYTGSVPFSVELRLGVVE